MSELKLWCWKFCPFAQRSWVSFLKSGVNFKYCEINPYEMQKNSDWRAISPKGYVFVSHQHGIL